MFSFKFTDQFVQKTKPLLSLLIFPRPYSLKISRQRKPIERFPYSKSSTKTRDESKPVLHSMDRVRKVYNILRYHPWVSAHEELENLDFKWDSFTVTQVLKTHPPMEKAWLFFNWASRKKKIKHDQYTYTTMMDIFGEAKRISSMMLLFDQMKEKKIKIDVVTYTSLMHWISNSGDVDGAVKLWKEMKVKRLWPTVVSYTAYINILLHHKRVNEAIGVYKEMIESGIPPNRFTYTVLMEHLASTGNFGEAMKIFDQMQETGEKPDKPACNILIQTCSEAREVKTVMKFLQYMKANFIVLRYPVYRKALETLENAGQSVTLLKQVNPHFSAEHSQDDIIVPDITFEVENALVLSFLNKRNLMAVDFLLQEYLLKKIALETEVITKVIEASTSNNRPNGALFGYEYSSKMGVKIQRTAYLCLLGSFIRTNSHEMIIDIVEKMVGKGHSLGTPLNCLVIHRLGCNRKADIAAKVFDLIPNKERSCGEYTTLMDAFFCCGNADVGIEIFEQMMKDKGVDVAVGTHRVLMTGLEKCGRKVELEYYRKRNKEMLNKRSSSMEMSFCDLLFAGDFVRIPPTHK